MPKPFLHNWLSETAGIPQPEINRVWLEAYQLKLLKNQIALAKANSPFYRKHLAGYNPQTLAVLNDFAAWPQITPFDLKEHNLEMLCTSQSKIWRVITLQTSGTTGMPKQLFFSAQDLLNTARYFHYSLKTLARGCKNILVLMPGNASGSVGDVLHKATLDLPVKCHQFGIITDYAAALNYIKHNAVDFIIGIPAQILNLCRYSQKYGGLNQIKAVLFGADYVSPFCAATVAKTWRCTVIKHYGSTESALGAAVNCPCLTGGHIREADLLFEIVDPVSKQLLPDDEIGEIVITSLNYECMPLLRYNTGDLGAVSKTPCRCGSVLKRLTQMRPRHALLLGKNVELNIHDLDSVLYQLKELDDYEADLLNDNDNGCLLRLKLNAQSGGISESAVIKTVSGLPHLQKLLAQNKLKLKIEISYNAVKPGNPYVLKRKINDLRNP